MIPCYFTGRTYANFSSVYLQKNNPLPAAHFPLRSLYLVKFVCE